MVERAAVIGAGVMGSGIAAHIANAGVPVLLLDIVPEGAPSRNALAERALERLLKADPAPLTHPRNARLITPGNLEDDLDKLAGCDWIVEAIVEDLAVKRRLYERLESVRRPGGIVSSNTSTLPLALLTDGLPESLARDFLITHFFNPPRYMRLLELVAGPATRPEAIEAIAAFADRALGKTVVRCKDTPGFIANRIGAFWLQCAVTEALARGIDVEAADAVLGRPFGIPKTGVFGLVDLVGLDLIPAVAESLRARLPARDPFHAVAGTPELIGRLIADGYTGRKGKGGFYRLRTGEEGRVKEALDLRSGEYRPAARPGLSELIGARDGLEALLASRAPAAEYARSVMGRTLAYAASLIPEIADEVASVDQAMRLGYNWRLGPFELLDRIGPARLATLLRAEDQPVPPLLGRVGDGAFYRSEGGRLQALAADGAYREVARPAGVLLLSDIQRASKPLHRGNGASVWDIGDGVVCLEFHSKMNALDPDMLDVVEHAVDLVAERYRALLIHSEAEHFSVGVNLGLVLFVANVAGWALLEDSVVRGQRAFARLRYAPFPVVGAPSGMALGGGCEVLLHCDAVVAHIETYIGLPEVGVGLIPAWGGSTRMLERWLQCERRPRGPMPAITKTFELLGLARVARSALEARDHLYLREQDSIVMNRDRVLAEAKARALALAADYRPPVRPTFALPGPSARLALMLHVHDLAKKGQATAYDCVVAERLAEVLSGGATDLVDIVGEEHLLALERRAALALMREERSLARMAHMLDTGKPLRN